MKFVIISTTHISLLFKRNSRFKRTLTQYTRTQQDIPVQYSEDILYITHIAPLHVKHNRRVKGGEG